MSKILLKFLLVANGDYVDFQIQEQRESTRIRMSPITCYISEIPNIGMVIMKVTGALYPEIRFRQCEIYLRGSRPHRDEGHCHTSPQGFPIDIALDLSLIALKEWTEFKRCPSTKPSYNLTPRLVRYYRPERSPDNIYEY